jgi:hypothetical protein
MPIVTRCTVLGCKTMTIGPLCIDHDVRIPRPFVRGRPSPDVAPLPLELPLYSVAVGARVRELRKASVRAAAARAVR